MKPFNPLVNNPLTSRDDFARACISLLDPLIPNFSPGCSVVKLGETGTRYDETAAQIEGYARPLWALSALLAGGYEWKGTELFIEGLANGTDPDHEEYWGVAEDTDQRMVEMCPMGFTLAIAGDHFWGKLNERQKGNVAKYFDITNKEVSAPLRLTGLVILKSTNVGTIPDAQYELNGYKYDHERMEKDMNHLDTFYRGEGWSNDGPDDYTQMDYYSGSFAIQYLQLLYARIAGETDPVRAEKFKERARIYALDFIHYFHDDGRAITFGRSLTYKFAMVGFWAAVAFADVELPAPLTRGVVKGVLLRNLRWWSQQPGAFTAAGTLTIGYTYPNQFMSDNYNSPGSPYWAMLSFVPLALSPDHPFWMCREEPFPTTSIPQTISIAHPGHIVTRLGGHTFLLSSKQRCHYPLRAADAKYGKFAYSSAFAYSVPTGAYSLWSSAPDSTLSVTYGDDAEWRTRKKCNTSDIIMYDGIPVLSSTWKPLEGVEVKTWLIPPQENALNWHIRAHHITTTRPIKTAEGSFTVSNEREYDNRELSAYIERQEGRYSIEGEAFAVSRSGCVGILDAGPTKRTGETMNMDSNSNLLLNRTVCPLLLGDVESEAWYITFVFALPARHESAEWKETWRNEYNNRPSVPSWLKQEGF
ncbi:hypothetical protein H072_4111 [Dactylellina haptotyla CBS 200.50]|uniref:DUF2264 domain-containing protein n=1 Tax=Dactylellina haptotyla (strain CBS 200.50) TaxID=1284197 RepID=S8AGE6_DACHA|nr:hypothetical protein H072_4111 [Dactylellina haptotyla CBS 200.50]